MRHRLLSSLSWKAGIAIAATALAAGTGAGTVHLVGDSHRSGDGTEVTDDHDGTTTTTEDTTTTTSSTTVDDDHDADASARAADDDATDEHPDNFGAVVSEDAKDGGVDGHEISDMAHARNDARRAEAGDDTEVDDDEDEADHHGREAGDDADEHRGGDDKGGDQSHEDGDTDD
jgi:hypothetical protein